MKRRILNHPLLPAPSSLPALMSSVFTRRFTFSLSLLLIQPPPELSLSLFTRIEGILDGVLFAILVTFHYEILALLPHLETIISTVR